MTASQVVDAPAGFKYSTKIDITTADTSLASGQNLFLVQYLEGYNMSHLQWGTANAKTVTLSFWVKSTKTGTYSVTITNNATSKHNVQDYTISQANTWEKKTLTYTGDTDTNASWATDANIGMRIRFGLATGSGLTTGTLGSWGSGDKVASSSCENGLDSTSNDFFFTGVQLELGSAATAFEYRSYGDELARCQRYYYLHGTGSSSSYGLQGNGMMGANGGSPTAKIAMWYPVPMRTKPSATFFNANEFRNDTGLAANDSTFNAIWSDATSVNVAWVDFTGGSGGNFSESKAVMVYSRSGSNAKMAFSAEF